MVIARGGFILRSLETILAAYTFHLGAVFINVAEMPAYRVAIIQAKRMGIHKLHIEGDSKEIIEDL